jgi:ABC-type nitrate/sulfonate/bicarbonate transport system ATPase subunit
MSTGAPKIAIAGVSKDFVQYKGSAFRGYTRNATHALGKVSLNVRENEFVSIVGPSGCGRQPCCGSSLA